MPLQVQVIHYKKINKTLKQAKAVGRLHLRAPIHKFLRFVSPIFLNVEVLPAGWKKRKVTLYD